MIQRLNGYGNSIEDRLTRDLLQAEAERDGAVRAGDILRRQRDRAFFQERISFWLGVIAGFIAGLAVGGVFAV